MICQCLADQLLFASADLLTIDNSRYFAQPRPLIANYLPTLLPNIYFKGLFVVKEIKGGVKNQP